MRQRSRGQTQTAKASRSLLCAEVCFAHRLSSSIVPYYERERLVKLDNVLVVWAERPDAFDQHLQQCTWVSFDWRCVPHEDTKRFHTLSIVHILPKACPAHTQRCFAGRCYYPARPLHIGLQSKTGQRITAADHARSS